MLGCLVSHFSRHLLDGLLTVFTALFPILARTSGSDKLTDPPSAGKLFVGVAGDLKQDLLCLSGQNVGIMIRVFVQLVFLSLVKHV